MKPEKHLPDAAKLPELAEDQFDRITLALVRRHLDAVALNLLVARRQRGKQLPALRHRHAAFQGTLTEQRQLHLVELAFQTQVHPVIDERRVVEPFPVADQAADDGTEVQQRMPFTAISRQS